MGPYNLAFKNQLSGFVNYNVTPCHHPFVHIYNLHSSLSLHYRHMLDTGLFAEVYAAAGQRFP